MNLRLTVIPILCFLVAGCGRAAGDPCSSGGNLATSGRWYGLSELSSSSQLAEELGLFQRTRTSTDLIPRAMRKVLRRYETTANTASFPVTQGRYFLEESRLVVRGKQGERLLYAFPTGNGWICVTDAVASHASAPMCWPRIESHLAWVAQCDPTFLAVFGLVDDSVNGVRIELADTTARAIVGDNAFYWSTSDDGFSTSDVREFRVRHRDGSISRVRGLGD